MVFKIEFVNWEKFNPTSRAKTKSWFRVDTNIFEHPEISSLSANGQLLFIYLLSRAITRSGQCQVSAKSVHRVAKLRQQHVIKILTRWQDAEMIRFSFEEVSFISSLRTERTERTNRTNRTNEPCAYLSEADNQASAKPELIAPPTSGGRSDLVQSPVLPVQVKKPKPAKVQKPAKAEPSTTALVWRAYRDAFAQRYGEPPPQNARTMGQLAQFVSRLPAEEAPPVAEFFVNHNDSFYVRSLHPVSLLLRDAEKIRTEWKVGRQMTGTKARAIETVASNQTAVAEYLTVKGDCNAV